jgi:hypothetical protein
MSCRAIGTRNDSDVLIRQFQVFIEGRNGRCIPLRDLAEIDVCKQGPVNRNAPGLIPGRL